MEENGNEETNEEVLSEFRNQWRQELQQDTSSSTQSSDEFSEAKKLFLLGVELERKGKCFEAVRHYRRAVQLVPDIEYKIYSQQVERKELAKKKAEIDNLPNT